jgi:hypothetical protein
VNLSTDFRQRAVQQRDASFVLVNADDFEQKPRNQVAAIVGQLNATIYDALADTIDYLRGGERIDAIADRRRAILERNDAIRRAAASGNWNEFDRLTGNTTTDSPGGDEADGGSL